MLLMVGSLKMNTTLEYSTRVVQEGDRRCKMKTKMQASKQVRVEKIYCRIILGAGSGSAAKLKAGSGSASN